MANNKNRTAVLIVVAAILTSLIDEFMKSHASGVALPLSMIIGQGIGFAIIPIILNYASKPRYAAIVAAILFFCIILTRTLPS